jgi:hypothetical protein
VAPRAPARAVDVAIGVGGLVLVEGVLDVVESWCRKPAPPRLRHVFRVMGGWIGRLRLSSRFLTGFARMCRLGRLPLLSADND